MLKSLTIHHRQLVQFFCYLLVCSLVFSLFLLSVSMISLAVLGVFRLEIITGQVKLGWYEQPWQKVKTIFQHPSFAVFLLFFLVALLRFYPVGDATYLLERLRIKVPFVVLPLAFLLLPRFRLPDVQRLLYFMLLFFSLVSTGIVLNYINHYEPLTELIKKGHHIPTPGNHIRYSLLVAWTIMGGIYLLTEGYYYRYRGERWLIGGLIFFLFVFLHLLSVKSGLLVLYICLAGGIVQYGWQRRAFLAGALGLGLLVCLPLIAYQTIPTFKNKVTYFLYDMFMYQQGQGAHYSDSGRLASLHAGWHIATDHRLWGVGTANIRDAVRHFFVAEYPNYPEVFMPQNQFLFTWAATGIFGLLLTVFAFLFPIFYRQNYRHWLFLNFQLAIFAIIMIEHALENAVGIAHYLFFSLLFLSLLNGPEEQPRSSSS
ncbi:MAG: hypothetical protein DA408_04535 [Bacteroidetes bacterium]|nr:MAG: hypothetical protein DA408_04535 [Bacteroidota bacterium]